MGDTSFRRDSISTSLLRRNRNGDPPRRTDGRAATAASFLSAVVVATAIVLSAPFMGQARAWLRTTFPREFVAIVQGSVVAVIAVCVVIAVARIRDRRRLRYGAIAAALLLGLAYNAALATGNPEIDAVERVHFVEYGVIALLFSRAWRPRNDATIFVLPLLAGVIVGVCEEWFQWFIPVRVGELRDVALNLVALGCGLLFSLGVSPPQSYSRRLRRGSLTRVGVFASAAVLALASFVHAVHLGYVISGDDVGSFKSRYRAEQLHALAADRALRWRQEPPLTFRRLSREDQYMDEGLWHVRRRNEAWASSDYVTAWRENRILEEYFAPVLDTPSYVSVTGHRWHPDQRAAAERATTNVSTSYISGAEPLPIVTWPKAMFWSVVATLVAALAGASWRRDRRSVSTTPVPM
jgi:VanZ family protein